jgi:16S rRNA (guanine527-N7)-methyltransferase
MTTNGPPGGPDRLTDAWCDRLALFISQAPVNLVSRADRADVRRLHIDEAVAVAQYLRPAPGSRWMDLGTGGGLPGLVLAASFPRVRWTLLDARAKKLAQVQQFAAELGLENVRTLHGRAEQLVADPTRCGAYAGVIARAVGQLGATIALCRGFVEDGEIVAIRGPRAREEAESLVPWSEDLGITVETVEHIGGTMRPTWLVRVRGRGPAPARFPRARTRLLQSARGGTR